MAIPDYETLMLPLLRILSDGREHQLSEDVEKLSNQFHLTEEERNQLLPSGKKPVIYSRVHWAKTYMKSAGLVEMPERGKYKITPRGLDVLKKNPPRLNDEFLNQYPEFVEFQRKPRRTDTKNDLHQDLPQTPEEMLETSYQNLRDTLAQELLERIKNSAPKFFEELVVDLLVAMGYGGSRKDAGQAVGQSGDSGIDGIIKEDKLGLDAVYIQAKKWDGPVGRPQVQNFVGSLEGFRATKGVFITTSKFAQPAIDYAKSVGKKIVLIDGEELAQLMIDHNVGVAEVATYRIKRVDLDYFGEE